MDNRVLSASASPVQPGVGGSFTGTAAGPGSSGAGGGSSVASVGDAVSGGPGSGDTAGADAVLLPGRVLSVDLNAIDFSQGVSGQTLTRPLRIRNAGDTAIDGLSVSVRPDGSAFGIASTTCGSIVGPGATCDVSVSFTPLQEGALSAELLVSGSDVTQLLVPLSGVGVTPGSLTSDVSQIDFGVVEWGIASEPRQWVITNSSPTVSGPLRLEITDPAAASAETDCGPPLAAGASCSVNVRYTASPDGPERTDIAVFNGDESVRVYLQGQGAARLTVTRAGTGSGQILIHYGPGEPTPCDDGCSLLVPAAVRVEAVLANGSDSFFTGWSPPGSGSQCTTQRECAWGSLESETLVATFEQQVNNLAFISSEAVRPDLGSTAEFDAQCNRLATASGINDAAGTGYIAAISGPDSFLDRIPAGVRGWVRLDGMPLADTTDALLGPVRYPLTITELGVGQNGYTWAGGNVSGDCEGWTTRDGSAAMSFAGRVFLTGGTSSDCSVSAFIYCLGVTKTAPLAARVFSGKRIWLTPEPIVIGTDTPDAACQASRPAGVASAAALVGYTNRSAASVLDPAATYVRVDGARVGTGQAIGEGRLATALSLASDGSIGAIGGNVWTGGALSATPPGADNCYDWQEPSGTAYAGDQFALGLSAFSSDKLGCGDALPVYCIEL